MIVSDHNNSCWGTNMPGTDMSGHRLNVSGHKCVWAQSCLGTIESGHNRVWAQSCLGTVVWVQSCMGANVVEPRKGPPSYFYIYIIVSKSG